MRKEISPCRTSEQVCELGNTNPAISPAPLAQMCMEPASFMPDNLLRHECYSYSEDPAVEAECPDECEGTSHLDEADGTTKYHCWCEVSSAEECAEKYPGEGA